RQRVRPDQALRDVAPGIVIVVRVAGVAYAIAIGIDRHSPEGKAAGAKRVVLARRSQVDYVRFQERLQLRRGVAPEPLLHQRGRAGEVRRRRGGAEEAAKEA